MMLLACCQFSQSLRTSSSIWLPLLNRSAFFGCRPHQQQRLVSIWLPLGSIWSSNIAASNALPPLAAHHPGPALLGSLGQLALAAASFHASANLQHHTWKVRLDGCAPMWRLKSCRPARRSHEERKEKELPCTWTVNMTCVNVCQS